MLQGDLIAAFQFLKKAYKKKRQKKTSFYMGSLWLFLGEQFWTKGERFKWLTVKKFFEGSEALERVAPSRDVVDAQALDVFKAWLDGALSNLIE